MDIEFEAESPHRQSGDRLRSMEVAQWQYLVSRIGDAGTAKLIVEYLDKDPVQKSRLAGIYLRARDTLQRAGGKRARAWQQGGFIGRLLGGGAKAGKAPAGSEPGEETPSLVWPKLNLQ